MVTHISEICPPDMRPLYSGLDVVSYLCLTGEAGQCGREGSFDMLVWISHVCEGNAAELQVFRFILAASVVEWKLRIWLAASSSASFERRSCGR